jgi:hypothetical protein
VRDSLAMDLKEVESFTSDLSEWQVKQMIPNSLFKKD